MEQVERMAAGFRAALAGSLVLGVLAAACGPAPIPTATATVPATVAAAVPSATVPPTLTAAPSPTLVPTATVAPSPSPSAAATVTPAATATAQPAVDGEPAYLDDRSTPEQLMRSYFNAIERREYARAYGYWQNGARDLPPFPQFEQGYADTTSVQLTLGARRSGVGAGQLYYRVPVALVAATKAGAAQRFVGCYVLHLARPQLQAVPPFHPMAIQSATVHELPAGADAQAQLATVCPPV